MTDNTGIYQMTNGYWYYRFTKTIDGKRYNRKGTKDEKGQPIKNKRAAIRARQFAMLHFENEINQQTEKTTRKTFQDIYEEYCEKGRSGKAYATIKKQDSLWNNHIAAHFGKSYIDEMSIAEINDYLAHLYYVEGRAWRYVESFLKMFYLIYGQAYSRNYIDINIYNRFCVNKDTKISMPKMKASEDTEIIIFNQEEIKQLDEYFKGTNAETAYMLGRHCGLRINECYGLKWCNVDVEQGNIIIDRQMQYQDGIIKLVPLKTHNSKRTIYMSEVLKEYFVRLQQQQKKDAAAFATQRTQNKKFIVDLDGKKLSSLELVNTLPNGKIQTIHSMNYHSQAIKNRLQLDFKFHYLRHTYGTRLAELNTPMHLLCNQMGHSSGRVTEKYYLAISQKGVCALQKNLNQL